ncbi:MAG: bifunctional 5,10-methylene-tetrahydrofolate dehydrogenase/5,10-methylene-tetrahydrofolate cyclohydrolase [Bacteroidetes bacterium]|nr:bifunctional 5,10-methylene-tetrahydrofolate dehydrogenase/5,10-methylene-tetrahydrofolate cyclohydrolase [Bacteroidota bacterium]HET6245879.1 tetrahydrofolate dehydrogenase/cyclohydrolase catalytic domain-containing protein [Bacteroidia bacterium]
MELIDGKKISADIRSELAIEVNKIREDGKKIPHLAAILVGNNGASETYVAAKVKACEQTGFISSLFRFPDTISEKELLVKIEEINADRDIDGLIVQLPLPKHINEEKVTLKIAVEKDVDGFHPENIGKIVLNQSAYIPATPYGILKLLERYNIQTSGKNCVVIGRSNIVGSPMSILMSRNNYPGNSTVTLCHSKTTNLNYYTLNADIIIVALGKPGFLKADMVKQGAVVIDVGITRVESYKTKSGYKLLGDVDFENVAPKCSYITPVPGGVGPMTIAGLLLNTLDACNNKGDLKLVSS